MKISELIFVVVIQYKKTQWALLKQKWYHSKLLELDIATNLVPVY